MLLMLTGVSDYGLSRHTNPFILNNLFSARLKKITFTYPRRVPQNGEIKIDSAKTQIYSKIKPLI